ncbi:MAG: protein-L-isoaspartate O-methyltransferase [Betaproteobacteria bacterium]|jgi:protein-L-isoaspartate(D-aspartate) O-methyltransferase|nr:protein-L-isoaspartate O-methyltransferase [Betaproteobacteria bacterium]
MPPAALTPDVPKRSPIEQARFNMIEQQIRPWDVLDTRVLDLLAAVPRECYVPIRYQKLAFVDTEVPLGFDQSMWPPRVEGRCLQALQLEPGDQALEIGSGSGYLAALMAGAGATVTSYEIHGELARRARNAMANNGVEGVEIHKACGIAALDAAADHWDAIVLTGSVPFIPDRWLEQLKDGGRLFAVVGEGPAMHARLYTRKAGVVTHAHLFETSIPALDNAPHRNAFVF